MAIRTRSMLLSFRPLFLAFALALAPAACSGGHDDEGGGFTTSPVGTTLDSEGVWFITGGALHEVFDAMGYAVAKDRLWQAETFRRSARGTLAEIFGASQFETDVLVRTLGYSDDELADGFAALDVESRLVIQAYVDGFNRRIGEVRADPALVPLEFAALGFLPADWTVEDVLAWGALLQRNFDNEALVTGQIDNVRLLQELAAKFPAEYAGMFADLRWLNDPAAQTMIPATIPATGAARGKSSDESALVSQLAALPDLSSAGHNVRARFAGYVASLQAINAYVRMGSYAWAVDGSKTPSGHPVLYAGPQMGFQTPSVILEGSIDGGGLSVSGMAIAGLPVIVIGRTRHHAWSMQVGHAHTVDFYLEDPASVELHRLETIQVAGQDPVTLPVFRSFRGPIVEPLPYDPANPPAQILSWRYSHWGHEFDVVAAGLGIARAQSMDEFGAAVELLGVCQHLCYADRDGNIAYWMSGRDPVRPRGVDTRLVQLGDGTQDWSDPVVLKPRATDRNTSQGFYGGWNNKAAVDYDNSNNVAYSNGWFHRAHAIQDWSKANPEPSFEELRDLALDIACTGDSLDAGGVPWKFVSYSFRAAVQTDPSPERLAVLASLSNWDKHFVPGGPGAWPTATTRSDGSVLADAWIREVLRLTFEDELATATLTFADQPAGLLFDVLLRALFVPGGGFDNAYDWFQNSGSSTIPEDPDEIILLALDNVLAELGAPPYGVPRGEIEFVHDLLGPLWATPYSNRSTYAQCVELGPAGPVRIESMLPLGQSGNILPDAQGKPVFDPSFFGFTDEFDLFAPRPFPLFP